MGPAEHLPGSICKLRNMRPLSVEVLANLCTFLAFYVRYRRQARSEEPVLQ